MIGQKEFKELTSLNEKRIELSKKVIPEIERIAKEGKGNDMLLAKDDLKMFAEYDSDIDKMSIAIGEKGSEMPESEFQEYRIILNEILNRLYMLIQTHDIDISESFSLVNILKGLLKEYKIRK